MVVIGNVLMIPRQLRVTLRPAPIVVLGIGQKLNPSHGRIPVLLFRGLPVGFSQNPDFLMRSTVVHRGVQLAAIVQDRCLFVFRERFTSIIVTRPAPCTALID